jgi:AcrR family transcriptional regulator
MVRDRPVRLESPRVAAIRDDLTELFLAQGFVGLDLDAMAAHARCSKSTLYGIAESKEQLVAQCVEYYFRRAAQRVGAAVDAQAEPTGKVRTYLTAVAAELSTASNEFLRDVDSRAATRESYERHTAIAATRVRELITATADGPGGVRAHFLGEVTAAAMDAIERGGVSTRTGLTHAEAYAELADVVLAAIRPS